MLATGFAESGLRPKAVNPTSGASGAWQFLPSTWKGMGGTGSMFDPTAQANLAARGMAQAGARGLTGSAALQKDIAGFERPGPAGVQSDMGRALPFLSQAQHLVSQYGGIAPQGSAPASSGLSPNGGVAPGGLGLPAGVMQALGPLLGQLSKPIDPSKIGVGPQPQLPMALIAKLINVLGAQAPQTQMGLPQAVGAGMPSAPSASMPTGPAPPAGPVSQSVIDGIVRAARASGVDPAQALAIALEESGGRANAVGDQGSSYGLYQLHQGGALGSMTQQQADDPYANAMAVLPEWGRLGGGRGMSPADALMQYYSQVGRGSSNTIPTQHALAYLPEARALLARTTGR